MAEAAQKPKEQRAKFIEDRLAAAFDGDGKAADKVALQYAPEVTFTQDLKADTWYGGPTLSEVLQDNVVKVPYLRAVLPFIRSPTNVARFVWDRSPLALTRRQFWTDIQAGGERACLATGRLILGAAAWVSAVDLAYSDRITGGGPQDRHQRAQLEATGWKPYSVVVTHEDGTVEYVGYNRLDPFGMVLGLAADYAEVSSQLGKRETEEVAAAMVAAVAKNLSSQTYFQGLARTVEALAAPDKPMGPYMGDFIASHVPAAVNSFREDDELREVRSVMDALMAKIPGYTTQLDPRRNVLGEPLKVTKAWGPDWLSPFAHSEWRQDGVADELARLAMVNFRGFRPPPTKLGNVDLTDIRRGNGEREQSAYDRWMELTGTMRIGGKTVKEALEGLITSPTWETMTDGNENYDGSRTQVVTDILTRYRSGETDAYAGVA
ncbi:hypothetical protein [Azospirillum soli]|uniref:hypothetical protein n=1 Tax=Azospirillum soli TaxID=1304799 RepID=UPI001AE11780|nr:hypothetical protein [Azospirillum soli]MBP2315900.1 hypothetical protein [Azospirillum soli]